MQKPHSDDVYGFASDDIDDDVDIDNDIDIDADIDVGVDADIDVGVPIDSTKMHPHRAPVSREADAQASLFKRNWQIFNIGIWLRRLIQSKK